MFSEFCSIFALSCSFEFVWWWWYSQRLLSLNPTTVIWLFSCSGCGCCWAVTIFLYKSSFCRTDRTLIFLIKYQKQKFGISLTMDAHIQIFFSMALHPKQQIVFTHTILKPRVIFCLWSFNTLILSLPLLQLCDRSFGALWLCGLLINWLTSAN